MGSSIMPSNGGETGAAVSIRCANAADLPRIIEIYNEAVATRQSTADTGPATVESRRAWFEEHGAEWPLWVAEADGRIVGWLSFQMLYGRPAYRITAELSVYVAQAHQRQGIGSTLLAQAIEAAPALGLRNLVGFIFASNRASVRLCESFGFKRWGTLPGVTEVDGDERDVVIMGLRVAP